MKKIEKRKRIVTKKTVDELDYFDNLLNRFPSGILSLVSDSFDLWKVCTVYMPILKERILQRDGKLVIRPDSGDPVDIICGSRLHPTLDMTPDEKGVVELLWDVFGGTINDQGYKVLDPHIGVIYGDSITLKRAGDICSRLEAKGFASTNVVFGVGSYSMGYATRDNQGSAIKATYVEIEIDGIRIQRNIYKDPITDDGTKKSATGLLEVIDGESGHLLLDKVTWEEEKCGLLEVIFEDGQLYNETTLSEIREKIVKLSEIYE